MVWYRGGKKKGEVVIGGWMLVKGGSWERLCVGSFSFER